MHTTDKTRDIENLLINRFNMYKCGPETFPARKRQRTNVFYGVSENNKTFVKENGPYTIFDWIWLWIIKDFTSRTSVM